MKKSITILLLMFPYIVFGQSRPIGCRILDVISKDGEVFKDTGLKGEITLIDTFGLFSCGCEAIYDKEQIVVKNSFPKDRKKGVDLNTFVLGAFSTNRMEKAFSVQFKQIQTGIYYVYFLSIDGNNIKILDRKWGEL